MAVEFGGHTPGRRTSRMSVLRVLGLLLVTAIAWPTNAASLRLRDVLLQSSAESAARPDTAVGALVRPDLARRLTAALAADADTAPMSSAVVNQYSPALHQHDYATAVTMRRWDNLVPALLALAPSPSIHAHAATLNPSMVGAVAQRAAEQAAGRGDLTTATRLGARAFAWVGTRSIVGDLRNARLRAAQGEWLAAVAEYQRVILEVRGLPPHQSDEAWVKRVEAEYESAVAARARAEAGADRRPWPDAGVSNGSFTAWMAAGGLVPGWRHVGTGEAHQQHHDGRTSLEVCAQPGTEAVWLHNLGFRATAGTRYVLSGRARAVNDTSPEAAYIGIHVYDPQMRTTGAAYAMRHRVPDTWTDGSAAWDAPSDAAGARFVIGVKAGPTRACVGFTDLAATPVQPTA